ncbi:AMP-binding protein [Actinocorallia sp. API 0066]|uniref:AMP-binding protein n=1 Tax=Actinocorallia sp. API 0066 TaxID=2896846 RepID=UPI001E53FB18|nr:AMP-binding protein [Actinocorallia sp. API 0066]MCD0448090.1 AMP-binding protein [Actinocorallia sp. API 0066]
MFAQFRPFALPFTEEPTLREALDLVVGTARLVRDSGLLHPVGPRNLARLPLQAARFGATPALAGAAAALRFPARIAVVDDRGAITFGELEERSAAQATALRDLLEPGASVGVLCRNHRGFVEAVLAGSRLGHDVVLLNTDFSGPQLGRVLAAERVGVLVHDAEFTDAVATSGYTGATITAWHEGPASGTTLDDLAETPAEPLVTERTGRIVLLTSGTTGPPKGAAHKIGAAALLSQGFGHLLRVPLRSGEPILVAPPLFHGLGFTYLTVALALGSPLVLRRRFDPADVLKTLDRRGVGVLVAVPLMLQRLLDAPQRRRRPAALRVVLSGGAALHPSLARRFLNAFGDVLYNAYGASETGWAAIATPADLRAAPGTVGRPTLGVRARLLGPDGHEVPPGEIGTLYLNAGLDFHGYTGGGGKDHVDGLVSTGDLGHLDAEGRLFIDGRADDMIVSGGENVFPGEVEDVLEAHPGVAEAAVRGVPDEEFGQRLAAWVVPAPGVSLTVEEIKGYVKAELARYKVPRDVRLVTELPRTTTGKVRHGALSDG